MGMANSSAVCQIAFRKVIWRTKNQSIAGAAIGNRPGTPFERLAKNSIKPDIAAKRMAFVLLWLLLFSKKKIEASVNTPMVPSCTLLIMAHELTGIVIHKSTGNQLMFVRFGALIVSICHVFIIT